MNGMTGNVSVLARHMIQLPTFPMVTAGIFSRVNLQQSGPVFNSDLFVTYATA